MGLSIESKSHLEWEFGYGILHRIRHLSYVHCEGEKDFGEYMLMGKPYLSSKKYGYDWEFIVSLLKFPQLNLHSDCEGSYTLKDEINLETYLTGNSKKLLLELEIIINENSTILDILYFKSFYLLVKDVVENHDGVLVFC